MKISIGCDHGGFEYKNAIKTMLLNKGYEVIDVGCHSKESAHYPMFAYEAAKLVSAGECEFGIVICTSGEGVMMTANKVKGVRCGLGYNDDVTKLSRMHNDANMISFSQRFMALDDVLRRTILFLETKFEGGRHQTRVDLISDIEK